MSGHLFDEPIIGTPEKPVYVPIKRTNKGASAQGRAAIGEHHRARDERERERARSLIRALRKREDRDAVTGEALPR